MRHLLSIFRSIGKSIIWVTYEIHDYSKWNILKMVNIAVESSKPFNFILSKQCIILLNTYIYNHIKWYHILIDNHQLRTFNVPDNRMKFILPIASLLSFLYYYLLYLFYYRAMISRMSLHLAVHVLNIFCIFFISFLFGQAMTHNTFVSFHTLFNGANFIQKARIFLLHSRSNVHSVNHYIHWYVSLSFRLHFCLAPAISWHPSLYKIHIICLVCFDSRNSNREKICFKTEVQRKNEFYI